MATKQKRVRPAVDGIPWASAVRVKNSTGASIDATKLVYFSSVTGKTPLVTIADADNSDLPERTLWVTRTAIPDGGTGHVLPWIVQDGFTGLTPGAMLYMNNTGSPTPNPGLKAGIIVGEVLTATTVLVAPAFARASAGISKAEAITGGNDTIASPTKTLVARDSGTTYYVTLTGDAVIKLPAATVGLNFEFICQTTGVSKDLCLITAATTSDFVGFTRSGTSTTVTATIGADKSTIQMNGATATTTIGDYIRVKCDGTDWHVDSQTLAASLIFNDNHVLG